MKVALILSIMDFKMHRGPEIGRFYFQILKLITIEFKIILLLLVLLTTFNFYILLENNLQESMLLLVEVMQTTSNPLLALHKVYQIIVFQLIFACRRLAITPQPLKVFRFFKMHVKKNYIVFLYSI